MFCENCGNKIIENTSFCHNCGAKMQNVYKNNKTEVESVKDVVKNDGKPMSRETYMAHTNIKSEEEARGYLNRLNFLFVAVFLGMLLVKGGADSMDDDIYTLLWLADIALLIYFVYFCVKVIKAEKISKASAIFSIIFAPISWFWFYPDITDPLKIIIGKKVPPINFPDKMTQEERKIKDKKFWRKFWITIGVIFGVTFIIVILISLA